ncbi:hypothetical protein LEP1GSC043_0675 [Leptospira weilii str. Ecochallenge]|uniref:Uncharacterized protein n=1 Tax=Leptospira weilii str. Ecochallenge TaxID=1049986 RepID=N1TWG8_9LEPT|nr:hypothetical protein LEP1GSC043_0675 [Leptospira weilii str. Ecochallenge]
MKSMTHLSEKNRKLNFINLFFKMRESPQITIYEQILKL